MANYAIGDVQGCFRTLLGLLTRIDFDPSRDQLWFLGDLVNRGPRSQDTLSWLYDHQDHVHCVLGNHDLYLLARVYADFPPLRDDSLAALARLGGDDPRLCWLRTWPLLRVHDFGVFVHAGLLPDWQLTDAQTYAAELAQRLQSATGPELLTAYMQKTPAPTALKQHVANLRALTRIRMVTHEGVPDYTFAGPPEKAPKDLQPWFEARKVSSAPTIYFGHWASLGVMRIPGFVALDSGCVWKKALTALRLEDQNLFQADYADG